MGKKKRDRSKDSSSFSCSSQQDRNDVANLYPDPKKVLDKIKELCKNGKINNNTTFMEVYALIKEYLDYSIPRDGNRNKPK